MGIEKIIPIFKRAYEEAKNPENFLIYLRPNYDRFYGDKIYPFMLKEL